MTIVEELPLCECGCGGTVSRAGNRFIHGHNKATLGMKHSPESLAKMSKVSTERMSDPSVRKKASLVAIKQFSDPAARKKASLAAIKRCDNPEYLENFRLRMTAKFNDPEYLEKISLAAIKRCDNPEYIEKISKAHLNSVACKEAHETMRGGDDIVGHHFLYDHSDLSKYTMPMTRSAHTGLHNNLRAIGYEVPHINNEV